MSTYQGGLQISRRHPQSPESYQSSLQKASTRTRVTSVKSTNLESVSHSLTSLPELLVILKMCGFVVGFKQPATVWLSKIYTQELGDNTFIWKKFSLWSLLRGLLRFHSCHITDGLQQKGIKMLGKQWDSYHSYQVAWRNSQIVHDPDSGTIPGSTGTKWFSILDNFDNSRDRESWTAEDIR